MAEATVTARWVLYQMGDKGSEVRALQQALVRAGYPLTVDGDYGTETFRAVSAFQQGAGLPVDGRIWDDTFNALSGAPPKFLSAPQPKLTLTPSGKGPPIVKAEPAGIPTWLIVGGVGVAGGLLLWLFLRMGRKTAKTATA